MYKLTLSLLMMLCLVTGASAQGASGVAKKGANALKKNPSKGAADMSVKPPKIPKAPHAPGKLDKALDVTVSNAAKVATATPKIAAQNAAVNAAKKPARPASQKQVSHMAQASANARAAQVAKVEQLAGKMNLATQAGQESAFRTGIGKSVLFAPLMSSQEIGYSVTVFKTNDNGREEIFGILPSHALPNDFSHRFDSVAKDFQVAVKRADGTQQMLPAQVVQISPQSMLDISLVKFDPQAEPFLSPLRLAPQEAAVNEMLFSYGFAAGVETSISRTVNAQSFLSVRTNQAIEGAREGFCGSPLLDMNGDIKAIHTGTVEHKNGEDVSYGTHVTFIHKLIEAYHNNGQAAYDLIINGQSLARLNIDEYISAFYLYDANGKKIVQQNIEGKFSQSMIVKALQDNPQAAYLQLTSRQAQWTDENGLAILKENRKGSDKTKRQHWYNLQTQQREPTRPAIIKM